AAGGSTWAAMSNGAGAAAVRSSSADSAVSVRSMVVWPSTAGGLYHRRKRDEGVAETWRAEGEHTRCVSPDGKSALSINETFVWDFHPKFLGRIGRDGRKKPHATGAGRGKREIWKGDQTHPRALYAPLQRQIATLTANTLKNIYNSDDPDESREIFRD